ncbi:MAG: hypothetical protein IT370_30720 [Deltaproteobacteria bacterium]|nr:hypothetical protein [Deltaproteobacteria bacterium]
MRCRLSRMTLVAVVLALGFAAPRARASKPVARTLTGCVIDGAFFSIDGRATYRIATAAEIDLKPLEGKAVKLRGLLSPGDRFVLAADARPEVTQQVCPSSSLRLIKGEQVISLRVEATKAADAGDQTRAMELIAQAMKLLSPVDCDTLTDHAYVLVMGGDMLAAGRDVTLIKTRKCFVARRMNPLLLQDLGNLLAKKGNRALALKVLQVALKECDGKWCRPDIQKDLAATRSAP